mmetsp:Transcript_35353/g.97581  ORF Transcript_35353/g.97581 Transcript_35353/m.97581 type:complete len:203 (+) Transcript_35353:152-760(+)
MRAWQPECQRAVLAQEALVSVPWRMLLDFHRGVLDPTGSGAEPLGLWRRGRVHRLFPRDRGQGQRLETRGTVVFPSSPGLVADRQLRVDVRGAGLGHTRPTDSLAHDTHVRLEPSSLRLDPAFLRPRLFLGASGVDDSCSGPRSHKLQAPSCGSEPCVGAVLRRGPTGALVLDGWLLGIRVSVAFGRQRHCHNSTDRHGCYV